MPTITPLPTPPSTSDPANFATEADTFIAALPGLVTEINAFGAALNSLSTTTASTTSVAIGTGTKNFTVETGKSLFVGMSYKMAYDANNWLLGDIISYNSGTGALSIDVDTVRGSGTYAAWVGTLSFNGQIETPQYADQSITVSKLAGAVFSLFRGYIDGLTLSTAGSSATMSIAAGVATDSASAILMQLAASISKTTLAWAVGTGNGGLDTGVIANSTWYHFYLIRRPDTGVVDVIFSTSASAPTLPANYTQYRRIGSGRTNGSAQWTLFSQVGDEFLWDVALVDVDAQNPGTAAVTRTLTVPTGVKVRALINAGFHGGTTATNSVTITSLDVSDQQGQPITPPFTGVQTVSGVSSSALMVVPHEVRTNASAQVRSRMSSSAAADRLVIITRGWIDSRGKE
jgi:hypothetical protein